MNSPGYRLTRIISGGQTGADRGGLDAAIALGVAHGGRCPKDRRAEDGTIPALYQLEETESGTYLTRTRLNVHDADGTVIFTRGAPEGGSLQTLSAARSTGKPWFHVDLNHLAPGEEVRFLRWLEQHEIKTLNVAGSRESETPGIHDVVLAFLVQALATK